MVIRMHSCKFPHGISVLTTLFLCLGILFIILYTAVTELQAVMSDDEFQQGWDMLIADIDDFLNESGVVILKDEADGYTMDEIKSVLTQVSGSVPAAPARSISLLLQRRYECCAMHSTCTDRAAAARQSVQHGGAGASTDGLHHGDIHGGPGVKT
jgi:hypothetical protein